MLKFDSAPDLDLSSNMSEATWKLVAEKFMPHTDNMELGGLGEPTLAPIFCKAASEIVSAGKNLFFFTNGHQLGKDRILNAVGDSPRVSISIDAGTEDAYRKVRVGGELADLISNVETFRKAKPGAIVLSQFTATASNIDELPKWVELCARLGIGRHSDGAEISMVPADHHVTNRINQSLRFFKERTEKAIEEARRVAEREGIWFIADLKPGYFSELNANAGEDGSDAKGWRRYTDFLMGETPCGGTLTQTPGTEISATLPHQSTATGATEVLVPMEAPWFKLPEDSPLRRPASPPQKQTTSEPFECLQAPREVYIDWTGDVWACLARHRIGRIAEGGWSEIIEENSWYQGFLAKWAEGRSGENDVCRSCPRRK